MHYFVKNYSSPSRLVNAERLVRAVGCYLFILCI